MRDTDDLVPVLVELHGQLTRIDPVFNVLISAIRKEWRLRFGGSVVGTHSTFQSAFVGSTGISGPSGSQLGEMTISLSGGLTATGTS